VNPKISIIIPVYNVENYLEKCLDSILAQTFQDFNVYIVDDGSTDKTGDICDEYGKKDQRITVIHKKNEGVSVARNTAIELATGDYFLFFDGDDHVRPECLEELYETITYQKADAVLYGYYLEKDGVVVQTHLPQMKKSQYEGKEIMTDLVPRFIGVSFRDIKRWIQGEKDALKKENTALWRSMVKGDLIRRNNIRFKPQLRVGEDTCFTTEYLSCAKRCAVIHKCYYYLVVRNTSTIFVYEKDPYAILKGKIDLLTARRELTERIKIHRSFDIEKYWYGTLIMSCIQLAFFMTRKEKGRSWMENYRNWKTYVEQKEVQNAIKTFNVPSGNKIKAIPFYLLKYKKYYTLYCCITILQLCHYEFKR